MKKLIKSALVLTSSVSLLVSSALPALATDRQVFRSVLSEVNDSDVWGRVKMILDEDQLRVKLRAFGLEENKEHPQHIHGFHGKKASSCDARDKNHNGMIDLPEAAAVAGPPILSLTPFPHADNGKIRYDETFTVTEDFVKALEKRVVELHGMRVDGHYDPMLPIACGEIKMKDKNHDNQNHDRKHHGKDRDHDKKDHKRDDKHKDHDENRQDRDKDHHEDKDNHDRDKDQDWKDRDLNHDRDKDHDEDKEHDDWKEDSDRRGGHNFRSERHESTTNIHQENNADIENNVSIYANTGNNEANRNTKGGSIETGDVNVSVSIENNVNSNSVVLR